jgi:SAM-dependent methyltransferase
MTKNTSMSLIDMSESEIEEFIAKHLPVKMAEKKKYGEVFTPSALIKKILDFFPRNIWSNPDLKWLDPSCGTGNFMILVYQRLMLGLDKKISSESERSKHIIKNMLYMVELNQKNVTVCKQIFGPDANIVCSDFLADKHFFPDCNTFDCIIGNPPFQDDANVKGTGGKSKLYERIFLKAYGLLKDDGYLSFVVPDNMLSGNGNVAYKTLIKNDVQFVSFNSKIQAFFPGIQQYICYFFMQKKEPKNTVIEDTNGHKFTTQLLDRPVNPVRNWTPYVEKLLNKYVTNVKNVVVYNRGKSLSLYNGTKYSVIYTSSKKLRTNKLELAPGLNIKKAVIFGISANLEFEMDYTGKYGVGPNTFYIPFTTQSQGRNLEAFLKSDYYKTLALACKTSRQFLKIGFVEHLNLAKIFDSSVKTITKYNKSNKTKSSTKVYKKRLTNNKTRRKKDNVDNI